MTYNEDILASWAEDAPIDRDELGEAAINCARLHAKYLQQYAAARVKLRALKMQREKLAHEKYIFYTQGPTPETTAKGWKLPPIGRIQRADAPSYVTNDPDVQMIDSKIMICEERVQILDHIMKAIQNRGFNIKTAVDWAKYRDGA